MLCYASLIKTKNLFWIFSKWRLLANFKIEYPFKVESCLFYKEFTVYKLFFSSNYNQNSFLISVYQNLTELLTKNRKNYILTLSTKRLIGVFMQLRQYMLTYQLEECVFAIEVNLEHLI